MASPYELGAEVPVGVTCFSLEKLRSEAGRGPVSQQLCQELRRNHFVIVRPDAAGQAAVHDMWAQARRFFDLPAERKEDAAGSVLHVLRAYAPRRCVLMGTLLTTVHPTKHQRFV